MKLLLFFKYSQKNFKTHLKQVYIVFLSNIVFLIERYINKNIGTKPLQYTVSIQKKIARLFEKRILKVVTPNKILNNTQILSSCFEQLLRDAEKYN